MILNVAEFNKNNYSRKILQKVSQTTYRILEQDGLNAFFKTGIKYISSDWNFAVSHRIFKCFWDYIPVENNIQYQKDRQNPSIIHWAGGFKPWFYPDEEYAYIWWEYARKTPFYEEILARMIDYKIHSDKGEEQLLFVANHSFVFLFKKWYYKLKKSFSFSKYRKEKYKTKHKKLKVIIKNARKLKKQMMKV